MANAVLGSQLLYVSTKILINQVTVRAPLNCGHPVRVLAGDLTGFATWTSGAFTFWKQEEEEEKSREGGREALLRWYNGGDGLKVTISCLPPSKSAIQKYYNATFHKNNTSDAKLCKIFKQNSPLSYITNRGGNRPTSVFFCALEGSIWLVETIPPLTNSLSLFQTRKL